MKFSIKDQWAKWVLGLAASALPAYLAKLAAAQTDHQKRDAIIAANAALQGALVALEKL